MFKEDEKSKVEELEIDLSGSDKILVNNGFREFGEASENVSKSLTEWKVEYDSRL
jgi:hypothetical protein